MENKIERNEYRKEFKIPVGRTLDEYMRKQEIISKQIDY
jgi:hypothetical protein